MQEMNKVLQTKSITIFFRFFKSIAILTRLFLIKRFLGSQLFRAKKCWKKYFIMKWIKYFSSNLLQILRFFLMTRFFQAIYKSQLWRNFEGWKVYRLFIFFFLNKILIFYLNSWTFVLTKEAFFFYSMNSSIWKVLVKKRRERYKEDII